MNVEARSNRGFDPANLQNLRDLTIRILLIRQRRRPQDSLLRLMNVRDNVGARTIRGFDSSNVERLTITEVPDTTTNGIHFSSF